MFIRYRQIVKELIKGKVSKSLWIPITTKESKDLAIVGTSVSENGFPLSLKVYRDTIILTGKIFYIYYSSEISMIIQNFPKFIAFMKPCFIVAWNQ